MITERGKNTYPWWDVEALTHKKLLVSYGKANKSLCKLMVNSPLAICWKGVII